MLDMDEVLMEQAKAKIAEVKENRVSIMKKAPSFMLSKNRQISKNPSFFKKMFSMRNMDKVFADDDSQESSSQLGDDEGLEGGDDAAGGEELPTIDETKELEEEEDDDENVKKKKPEAVVELDSKYPYIDPPMPIIGRPVDMERLINRNKKAEFGLEALMQMVIRDVDESLKLTTNIPVASGFDRVSVTEEQSAYIAKVRTTKDIEKCVQRNVQHIQKSLNYRKSALIMMNSNYSNKLVRLVEPIYVNEARTILQREGDLGAPKHPRK